MMMKSLPNLTGPMPMWPRCVSLKISRIPIASAAQNRRIPSNRFLKSIFLIFFLSSDVRKQNRLCCNHQNRQNQKDPKSPRSGRFINRTAAFLRNRHQRRTKRVPHPSKFRAKCSNTTVLRSLKSIFPSQSLIALPGCGIHEDSDYGSQKVSNGLCANDSVITKACGRNQDYDGKNHALPAD